MSTKFIGDEHPAWCFCPDCDGGAPRVASAEVPCSTFEGDDELDATVDETIAFIKRSVRIVSRTVLQAHRTLNHYDRNGEYDMAFKVSGSNESGAKSDRSRKSKGLPFLDPERDLGADKRRIKILWAGDPKAANVHGDWARVTLKLQSISTNAKRLWTLGVSNPSLDVLVNALGDDAEQWKDREMWMWSDKDNPSETPYIRCEIIPTDASVQQSAAGTGATGAAGGM